MFNDSNNKSFTLSFGSWSTDRITVITQLAYQVDIGSAQNIKSPKHALVAQKTTARIGVPNKA